MNAQQRRRDQRRWRYQVDLSYDQLDRNGYDNMFDWCRDTFGNGVQCAGCEKSTNTLATAGSLPVPKRQHCLP
jgi:hypothetical protein